MNRPQTFPEVRMTAIIEDARKPAPRMAALLHSLAHPDPYGGNTDPEYRRAVDACLAAFAPEADTSLTEVHDDPMLKRDAA